MRLRRLFFLRFFAVTTFAVPFFRALFSAVEQNVRKGRNPVSVGIVVKLNNVFVNGEHCVCLLKALLPKN